MGSKSNGKAVLDVPVTFGGVSIGKTTCRLGIRIDRGSCNINAADDTFCGHRLSGKVTLGGTDDQPGQGHLVDDLGESVDGVFDVKQLGVTAESFSAGLTFSKADVDIGKLAKFSKGAGRLEIHDVGEIPEDAPDEDDDDREELPGSLKAEGPWRDYSLDDLFEGGIRKALKAASINTVGQLADYTATDKLLTDLDGIGPGKAGNIEERMLEFFRDNPDADHAEPAQA